MLDISNYPVSKFYTGAVLAENHQSYLANAEYLYSCITYP